MSEISKPDYRYIWASGGANVLPSITKLQTGWTSEVPPYQWENALQNRQDNMLVHINQHGIPQWDGLTEYFANKSYALGSDGLIYKAVLNSGPDTTTQDPVTDVTDTYWRVAFADASGGFLTTTTGDARYLQRSLNGSDILNAATFRNNISAAPLASPAFTGTPTAPTPATGTNNTQIATTAFVTDQGIGSSNQTLQVVTGARALSTNYVNSTPRPIFITVRVATQAGSIATNRIGIQLNGGNEYYSEGTPGSGAGYALCAQGIIPPGATYRVQINNAILTDWSELR